MFFEECKSDVALLEEALLRDTDGVGAVDWLAEDHRKELHRLRQVATRNGMALKVAHAGGTGLRAELEFSIHPIFPVVVLKRV